MRRFLLLFSSVISMLILYSLSIAQNNEFRILASKGDILIQKNGKGNWEKIFPGGQIGINDKIKLTQGSYAGLVHFQGKTIELKKDGVYSATKLSQGLSGKNNSMSSQIANLIVSEVDNSSGILSKDGHKKSMAQSGAVERNLGSDLLISKSSNGSGKILFSSPVKTNYINNDIIFEWNNVPSINYYEFVITDRFDRPELIRTLHDTSININSKELKLEKGVYYFWKVTAKDKPEIKSDEACFMLLTDKEISGLNDTLKLLKSELGSEPSAASQIIYAVFFEKCNLISEARTSFLEAIKLAPDVEVYDNLYHNFLHRHYQINY